MTPDGRIIVAELPDGVIGGFNLELHRFVLMLYHQGQSTIPRITALLDAIGLDISERQVRRLLTGNREPFVGEAAEILKAGLEGAAWISVDDTGARHQGRNGYCISIGNDCFGWFGTTGSKSRLSFLDTMCGALDEYVLNDEAFRHMESHSMPRRALDALRGHAGSRFDGPDLWMAFLDGLGIDAPRARLLATEGARLGCLFAHGLLREDSAILSDDAGQFDLGLHQFLCWIHAERLYRTLPGLERRQPCGRRSGARRHLADVPAAWRLLPPAKSAQTRRRQAQLRAHLPDRHRLPPARRADRAHPRQPRQAARRARPSRRAGPHQPVPRTTFASVSSAARSRAEPARIKAVPAATPSSPT